MLEQQVNQEQVNQSSPEANETPPETSAAEGAPPAEQPAKSGLDKLREKGSVNVPAKKPSEEAAAAAVVAAYKANIKFKAAGKEMEVPEYLRGVMKDAETEKHLHSLLSKAHGIEMIQDKLKGTRAERDEVRTAYQQVMEPIKVGQEAYRRDDLDTVWDVLKIDPQKVLQWAVKKVQLSQMPPDQRQVHEEAQAARKRAWELERQNEAQHRTVAETQSEQINQMLDLVLERQDISPIAQAYDTRKGKEGSFRDLCFLMGNQEFASTGKVISPMEAAKRAVELLGEKFGAQAVTAAPAPAPVATPAPATEKPKVTLPNTGGSKAASPARGKVKSLDDLRKLHQQMASN